MRCHTIMVSIVQRVILPAQPAHTGMDSSVIHVRFRAHTGTDSIVISVLIIYQNGIQTQSSVKSVRMIAHYGSVRIVHSALPVLLSITGHLALHAPLTLHFGIQTRSSVNSVQNQNRTGMDKSAVSARNLPRTGMATPACARLDSHSGMAPIFLIAALAPANVTI